MTTDTLSPLEREALHGLLRYAAGRAITCAACGAVLDWRTVQDVEATALDADGAKVGGHTVIVCGDHDVEALLADAPRRILDGMPEADRVTVTVTSRAAGLDAFVAEAGR